MRLHLHVHLRRAVIGFLVVTALATLSASTLAGGFAVVRLDETPGEVAVDTPWRFGFTVRQHDVTPTNDVAPIVRAIHKETGGEVTATGKQVGPVGHFEAEITFPHAGEWKWAIHPEPFAETSLETLIVVEQVEPLAYPASIVTGSCANLGDDAFSLGDVETQATAVTSSRPPVAVGSATIETPLPELISTRYAITIGTGDTGAAQIACGDILALAEDAASESPSDLVLGLRSSDQSRDIGVAVLSDDGNHTTVTLYLLNGGNQDSIQVPSDDALTIEIVGNSTGDWIFRPGSLQIPAGATIAWMNNSNVAHTITGDDLAFDDSGLIEPGQSFSQTFAEPGAYHYRCAPHPWMEGVIVAE
jgi:plastocyanin